MDDATAEMAESLEYLPAMTPAHFLHEEDSMRRTGFPGLVLA